MKAISISGGSTKIVGLLGVVEGLLEQGIQPNIVAGVSAGALLAVPTALGLPYIKKSKEILFKLTLDDIFSIKPVNENNQIRFFAALRLFFGKLSLGKQDKLIETLRKVVSKDDFELFKKGTVKVYIGTVDLKSAKRVYFLVNDLSYEDYLRVTLASASIPVFVEPVEFQGYFLVDGGLRDHNPAAWLLKKEVITELHSIYSRPEDYILSEPKLNTVLDVLNRTIDIMSIEISKSDEVEETLLANNIKHKKYFLPSVLNSLFDTNTLRLQRLYHIGRSIAHGTV